MGGIIKDKFQENWIVLDLQNLNNVDSTVNLFNPTIDYSGTFRQRSINLLAFQSGQWIVRASKNGGGLITYIFDEVTDLADLISKLNETFTYNGVGVFTYDEVAGKFYLEAYVDLAVWDFFNVSPPFPQPTSLFADSSTTAATGSSVQVTSESNVTMNEITQEVAFQAYKMNSVNIYADNINQANNDMTVGTRTSAGVQYRDIKYPAINPIQRQFALENVELGFIPSVTNKLLYKVDANQRVRLIFKYSKVTLGEVGEAEVVSVNGFEEVLLPPKEEKEKPPLLILLVQNNIEKEVKRERINNEGIKRLVAGYLFSGNQNNFVND